MAIRRRRHKHGREGRRKHTDELSAMLAPLEELKPEVAASSSPSGNGEYSDARIRVDSQSVKMPGKLLDEGEDRQGLRIFYLEPVVIVILVIMLTFIAFIAWQIARMPAK